MWFNFNKNSRTVTSRKRVVSDMNRGFGNSSSAGETAYYNPVWDSLDEGSLVDQWIPRTLPRLNKMFRGIYLRDGIAGPAVDIWAGIPWSTFEIAGIEDPEIKKFYEEAFFPIFTPDFMEDLTKQYLVEGRFCASLVYDNKKGYWTKIVPLDSDFLKITPIPRYGYDPIIDYLPTQAMKDWVLSTDSRIADSRLGVNQEYLDAILNEDEIHLYPMNTLWVARSTSPNDYVGTSLYTRILPFWALEKPLINASIISSRRRAGSILHITAGLDDVWEPTEDELNQITDNFKMSDEDPTGAIVTTRTGINVTEVSSGGNIWKISDEWDFLSNGKMRALGINDSFLSGDSTYTSYESARTLFVEQVRTLRDLITRRTIMRKAEDLARIHGLVKRSSAELSHKVRIKPAAQNLSMSQALSIPYNTLILPEIRWKKPLSPQGDEVELELLQTLADNGFPVTLRSLGSAAGLNLDNFLDDLDEDLEVRRKIGLWSKYKTEYEDGELENDPTVNIDQFKEENKEEDDFLDFEEDGDDFLDFEEEDVQEKPEVDEVEEETPEIETTLPEKEDLEEKKPEASFFKTDNKIDESKLNFMLDTIPWVNDIFYNINRTQFKNFLLNKGKIDEDKKETIDYLLARLGLQHEALSLKVAQEIWFWLTPNQKPKELYFFKKLGFIGKNKIDPLFKEKVNKIIPSKEKLLFL